MNRYTLNFRMTRPSPLGRGKSVYESSRELPPQAEESLAMTEAILDRQGLILSRAAYWGWRSGTTEWWIEEVA